LLGIPDCDAVSTAIATKIMKGGRKESHAAQAADTRPKDRRDRRTSRPAKWLFKFWFYRCHQQE
jgi:hypothetical protein